MRFFFFGIVGRGRWLECWCEESSSAGGAKRVDARDGGTERRLLRRWRTECEFESAFVASVVRSWYSGLWERGSGSRGSGDVDMGREVGVRE